MSSSESVNEPFSASDSEYEPENNDDSTESDSDSVDESSKLKLGSTTKHVGRKRNREPSKPIKNVRKEKRNCGEQYVSTSSNKVVKAKEFHNRECTCKGKCIQKISQEERKDIFTNFWNIANFSAQNAFLVGIVKLSKPATHRPRNGTRQKKAVSYTYVLNTPKESHKVCKMYFLETFAISNGRLMRALKKGEISFPGEDLRGKHAPSNKTPEGNMQLVRDHINSFPSFESHYTRAHNPNRKFLDPELNVRTMYTLYKEKCVEDPVSESLYRQIFHRDFNLHFHVPLKDTCVKCDKYKNQVTQEKDENTKKVLQSQHELHLRRSEKARAALKDAKITSIREKGRVCAFTFDLEKALPFPTLTCSVAYYKRNIYVYNLGIHEFSDEDKVFLYAWDETIASRGAQEIGSCIRKHVLENAKDARHIIAFSDACGGQNRNFKQCLFWLKLIADSDNLEMVDHKFMVSGHSFLPNDRDFGVIEQYAKNRVKYVPDDWYSVFEKCRTKKPYRVCKMNGNNFVSSQNLEAAVTRRKKNEDNAPVSWLKIQWLQLRKSDPYKIFYKETLDEEFPFDVINLQPARK